MKVTCSECSVKVNEAKMNFVAVAKICGNKDKVWHVNILSRKLQRKRILHLTLKRDSDAPAVLERVLANVVLGSFQQ